EGSQDLKIAPLGDDDVSLPQAQQLHRGAETASGSQGAFGDHRLHAVVPGSQPDDFRGLAVADRRKHHRGSRNQRHAGKLTADASPPPRYGEGGIWLVVAPTGHSPRVMVPLSVRS